MGFRFRRSVKIMPGVRLNLGRRGISTSFGGKGATLNVSKKGTRGTVGISGSGLSYSTLLSASSGKKGTGGSGGGGGSTGNGCILAVFGGLLLLLVGMCSGQKASAPPQGVAALGAGDNSQSPTMAYVAARTLNCRALSNAEAAIVAKLRLGDPLILIDSQREWSKVQRSEGNCWVATRLISDTPPEAEPAQGAGASSLPAAAIGGALAAAETRRFGDASSVTPVRQTASQKRMAATAKKKRNRKAKARSSQRSNFGGSCPCSGSTVCIGPRGGRYCITSGGNKRYGV